MGLIGAAYGLAFTRGFLVETGVGVGMSGAHVTLMPTLSWGSDRYRFFTGVGASLSSECCLWANVDAAGYEYRGDTGSFIISLGATMPFRSWSQGMFVGSEAFIPLPTFKIGGGWWVGGAPVDAPRPLSHQQDAAPVPSPQRHQPVEDESAWTQRVSVQIGLGAPLGFAGVGWAVAPLEWLRTEAGAGYGFTGLQLSMMPMVAFGSRRDKFVAGAGLSVSTLERETYHSPNPEPPRPGERPAPAPAEQDTRVCPSSCLWFNADLAGYEHNFDGVSLFLGGGLTGILTGARQGEGWGPQLHFGAGWIR